MSDGDEEITGHSRALRERLQAAREAMGLSRKELGALVAMTDETVRLWEKFERHPPIDVYARWARVLGHRLVVDVVPEQEGRVPTFVRPENVELVRRIDALDPQILEFIGRLVDLDLAELRQEDIDSVRQLAAVLRGAGKLPDKGTRFRRLVHSDIEDAEAEIADASSKKPGRRQK